MKRAKNGKIMKSLTTIIFCLVAIILIIVGFVGVYFPKHNKLVNLIPDYTMGTDLYGIMEYRFSPDNSEEEKQVYVDENGNIKGEVIQNTDTETSTETTEENLDISYNVETRIIKANEDKKLTKENFEKVKTIINQRLKKLGATEYAIRMDNVTGNMIVELSRNDDISFLYKSALALKGEFRVTDYQTGVILLDNSYIKDAYSNVSQTSETGYTVYLQVELNKDGAKILKDISNKYREYTTSDGITQRDFVAISIDGTNLMTTYFNEEYNSAILNIPVSEELTDTESINTAAETATALAEIINLGELPIKYVDDSQLFIKSLVQEDILPIIFIVMYIVLIVALVILTIKFKLDGFVAGILNAGFVALVTIILRYLEIVISMSSLMALFVAIGLNVMFLYIYLSNKKDDEEFFGTLKKYYSIIMPVIIISFIFTFFVSESISGIGNVLFWALLVQVIYNFVFTRFAINDK